MQPALQSALLLLISPDLVREYNSFYQAVPILGEEDLEKRFSEFNCLKKWQIRLRHHLSY
jgi:hypothetical protein